MSDALSRNAADEAHLIRCHCLAHGRRKFSELEEVLPAECQVVLAVLKQVFDHAEVARRAQREEAARLAYHQHYSAPLLDGLKAWLKSSLTSGWLSPTVHWVPVPLCRGTGRR